MSKINYFYIREKFEIRNKNIKKQKNRKNRMI